MSLYLWNKNYEIGVTEVDNQHRKLVGMINDLSDAMMDKKGYLAIPHTLEQLGDYVQLHFTTEEEVMRDSKYPALEEHTREHLDLTKRFLEYKRAYSLDHESRPGKLLDFLRDWLKNHILESDKKIGNFIKTLKE